MRRVEDPSRSHQPTGELAALQLKVVGFAALVTILSGMALLALGSVDEARAGLQQHLLASESDARISRYAVALQAAYEVVVSDFEDGLVSFEYGALPTTADGQVIGLPHPDAPIGPNEVEPPLEEPLLPSEGDPLSPPAVFEGGVIRIPAIGLNQTIVEGVSREMLKLGPGHYPGTALPGQPGNVVISGHRTTYSKPFHDLDLLTTGDPIVIETPSGSFRYEVAETLVVPDDDARPLLDTVEPRLTLTTCHPKGSARERLVVVASLVASQEGG
jgi:LPXTG-site transpeptidase (sortase) family protein